MRIAALGLLAILLPTMGHTDGTGKIYPDKPTTEHVKPIIPREPGGALYPWPTWHEWDGQVRPKHWNGYGVDPIGPNYYYYLDKFPCAYAIYANTPRCGGAYEEIPEPPKPTPIPEPSIALLLLGGIILGLIVKLRIKNEPPKILEF